MRQFASSFRKPTMLPWRVAATVCLLCVLRRVGGGPPDDLRAAVPLSNPQTERGFRRLRQHRREVRHDVKKTLFNAASPVAGGGRATGSEANPGSELVTAVKVRVEAQTSI